MEKRTHINYYIPFVNIHVYLQWNIRKEQSQEKNMYTFMAHMSMEINISRNHKELEIEILEHFEQCFLK